ncbi:MAG TPA: hypothetical protein VLW50_05570 [Streptosporangiaceae bacterium]|nr:hypothetical protein [Streptosporangiaceae bacterium]
MATERNPDWGKHPVRTATVGVGVAGYSWLAGGISAFTGVATISVAVPCVVLAMIVFRWPPERIPPPERLDITGASYWAIAAMLFFEWEASAFRDGSHWWHPTLSAATGPLLHQHVVKSALFAAWLLTGWGLIRR